MRMSVSLNDFVSTNTTRNGQAQWPARVSGTSDAGEVTTPPRDAEADKSYDDLLQDCGLDPAVFEIVEPVKFNRWQGYDGRWMLQDKFMYRRRGAAPSDDVDAVCSMIEKWRPRRNIGQVREGSFILPTGDTQFGKVDGDGTAGTVGRVLRGTSDALGKMRRALPRGASQGTVVLASLGDCVEGVWSQGGSLRARLDLTPTEQVRVVRRLMWRQIETFAPWAEKIVVPVVPGNHDEAVRTNGKMSTRYDDSWAIEAAVAVQDGIERNDDLRDRVEFIYPGHDELTVAFETSGTHVGIAHGHQFGNGSEGWRKWWNDQAGGRTPVGMADVLLAAHLHHLRIADHGDGRMFIQIPALDGGSQWFKHRKGDASPSRMVSFWTADREIWGLDPLITEEVK